MTEEKRASGASWGNQLYGRDDSPPADLRRHLQAAREQGLDFDLAWEDFMRTLTTPAGSQRDAHDWRKALEATRVEWLAAYEGWPAERRVEVLAELEDAWHEMEVAEPTELPTGVSVADRYGTTGNLPPLDRRPRVGDRQRGVAA